MFYACPRYARHACFYFPTTYDARFSASASARIVHISLPPPSPLRRLFSRVSFAIFISMRRCYSAIFDMMPAICACCAAHDRLFRLLIASVICFSDARAALFHFTFLITAISADLPLFPDFPLR